MFKHKSDEREEIRNVEYDMDQAPRRVLLNALPVNAFQRLGSSMIKIKYLGRLPAVRLPLDFDGESYISHPATAAILGVPVNRGFYQARKGDVGFIFTLATPARGTQDKEVNPQDIDVYWFEVL